MIEPAAQPIHKKANGVALALALSGDEYRVDIGSTPLGQDLNTVVGGVKWSPKLTNYLSLIFYRRASFADRQPALLGGAKDSLLRQNLGAGDQKRRYPAAQLRRRRCRFLRRRRGYSYLGQNVASNTSINANAGFICGLTTMSIVSCRPA